MTSENTGGETADSDVVAYRLDGQSEHRVLLVDGSDRYREQHSVNHAFLVRVGAALGAQGVGFDFCSNEAVVDHQIDLTDYEAVVWGLSEESTFDETFSWAEQTHVRRYLDSGGRLFVSGSEIGWDLDYRANYTYYENGNTTDAPFYNNYLHADYDDDDADTYHVQGAAGTLFAGLDFYFDDGSHGTYDVEYPDMLLPTGGATVGMSYVGGNACVYVTSVSGSVVNLGLPFEAIYPEAARSAVMQQSLEYFDLSVEAPTLKALTRTGSSEATIAWDGHAGVGFQLLQKTNDGSWATIQDEGTLSGEMRSATVGGLSAGLRYAFKVRAVNSGGAGADSDVLVCRWGADNRTVLLVDGYDRWNYQSGGVNHAFLENFADALSAHGVGYDSCSNESIGEGLVGLGDYDVVMWMCGGESTESETFGVSEQQKVQDYLKGGGRLFVSGAEIGWDLVEKAGDENDYSNGSPGDQSFYQSFLKANFLDDDAGTYSVSGSSGTLFEGLSFNFDDGTHGTYNVQWPDVIAPRDGSAAALYYGTGSEVAGVLFDGIFPGGAAPGRLIYFGFPFETIYNASDRASVMGVLLQFFEDQGSRGWELY